MDFLILFSNKFRFEIVHEGLPIEVADGQIGVGIEDDAVLVHFLYLFQIDDVGTVDAHEDRRGQPFFEFFHAEQHDERLGMSFEMYFQILAHAFDVAYVLDIDAHDFVFGFEEQRVIFYGAQNEMYRIEIV